MNDDKVLNDKVLRVFKSIDLLPPEGIIKSSILFDSNVYGWWLVFSVSENRLFHKEETYHHLPSITIKSAFNFLDAQNYLTLDAYYDYEIPEKELIDKFTQFTYENYKKLMDESIYETDKLLLLKKVNEVAYKHHS